MKNRQRKRDVWAFGNTEEQVEQVYETGDGCGVVLGLDGGATNTVCVCIPFLPFSDQLPDPLPILARAVAGCSNHNSVGGLSFLSIISSVLPCYLYYWCSSVFSTDFALMKFPTVLFRSLQ